ncbi:hypothetical protein [Rubellimicrobium sp. CFH 75288]|uniref:hypothetical protein n=1 Tax=Rubellimicrobium sp. CFH 75288 TaxID=2697034 RepID=UPI001412E7D0|nr:hypothetical protein [Rubellimicrobium sp. CFH 75288]NAZ36794.1 hypothetical protein [Rubellimicrobium sp. CFH 75288]
MPRLAAALLVLALPLAPPPVLAQGAGAPPERAGSPSAPSREEAARHLMEVLLLPEILEVMSREGRSHGADLGAQIFGPSPPPAAWTEGVALIHEAGTAQQILETELAARMDPATAALASAFFESEPGRSIAALELAAREDMLDDEVEQEAREAAAVAVAAGDPRLALLRRYVEATDLIEVNVASAMNASLAYFGALLDSGALRPETGEAELLGDLWSREAEIRAETTEWIYAFLLRAYGPASDADIEALIAFSESEPGRALTRALGGAFDALFSEQSRRLGLLAARYMDTREI